MFAKLLNHARIQARLVPDGPILIGEGSASPDPLAPDLAFVRTNYRDAETVYLPGSSLKGVLRAHIERLLRTAIPDARADAVAPDPLDFRARKDVEALRKEARRNNKTAKVYRESALADRLFGSVHLAGRFRVADAYPDDADRGAANRTETRYSVAIDRRKQAVRQGPFDVEAVTGGGFRLSATLENYDLWMLTAVLQAMQDLEDGFLAVGRATTRGFGALRVEAPTLEVRWPGHRSGEGTRFDGAGARAGRDDCRRYGLRENDAIDMPELCATSRRGLFTVGRCEGWDDLGELLRRLEVAAWPPEVTHRPSKSSRKTDERKKRNGKGKERRGEKTGKSTEPDSLSASATPATDDARPTAPTVIPTAPITPVTPSTPTSETPPPPKDDSAPDSPDSPDSPESSATPETS